MSTTASGFFYPATGYTSGEFQELKDMADSQEAVIRQTGIPRFADAAARTAAIPSPVLGSKTVLTSTEIIYRYNGSTWKEWESDWITWATAPTNLTVGTGGSAATVQRYKYIAGRIWFDYRYVLGTSGASMGTAPTINFPISVALVVTSATTGIIQTYTGTTASITSTAPMTWAAGDILAGGFWADPA